MARLTMMKRVRDLLFARRELDAARVNLKLAQCERNDAYSARDEARVERDEALNERDGALAVRANQEATIDGLGEALASAVNERDEARSALATARNDALEEAARMVEVALMCSDIDFRQRIANILRDIRALKEKKL